MTMNFLNETEDFPIPLVVEEYDGPFCIADRFRTMAEEICEAQGMKLPLRKILFMYDKTPYRDGPIGKALLLPAMTRDLLYQTTGCMFTAAIIFKHNGMAKLLEAQFSNEVYHCLRHFAVNAKTGALELVRRHEVEQWKEQASYSSGLGGFPANAPNLFDERIYPAEAAEEKVEVNVNANAGNNAQNIGTQTA